MRLLVILTILPLQSTLQTQKEGRLALATAALQKDKKLHVNRASILYKTSHTTLYNCLTSSLLYAIANAQKQKLYSVEEQSLIQWILDLD